MNRLGVKMIVVAASVAGLTGLAGATASAETFTPAFEEPTLDLGFGEEGNPLTRTPDGSGNSSSAEGRDGVVYGDYPYGFEDDSSSLDDSGSGSSSGDSTSASGDGDGASYSDDEFDF